MTNSKYAGMTQEKLIQEVNQKYMDFKSTFEKPVSLVNMKEVIQAWEGLKQVAHEVLELVSIERSYWYMYRQHNTAWSEWERVDGAIRSTMSEAWGIVEMKDWSKYQD